MLNEETKRIMLEEAEAFQQKVQDLLARFNSDVEFPNDKFKAKTGGGVYINAFTAHTEYPGTSGANASIGSISPASIPTKPMTLADKIKALRGTGGGVSTYMRRPQ